jgi:hypothetical protein
MVDPGGSDFTESDRLEFQALGPDGYAKLLGDQADGDYPDPFGIGTTYYVVSAGQPSVQDCRTNEEGRQVWSADVRSDDYPGFADLTYLVSLLSED